MGRTLLLLGLVFYCLTFVRVASASSSAPDLLNENANLEASEPVTSAAPLPGPSLRLSVGPGIAIYSGKYTAQAGSGSVGVSMNGGLVAQLWSNLPIFVGADLGLDSWSFSSRDNSAVYNTVGIQALPTAYYRFNSLGNGVYPYLGVSAGPNLYIAHTTTLLGTVTDYSVYSEVLLRPGVSVQVSSQLSFNFETKFGWLRSEPIFLPLASANVSL